MWSGIQVHQSTSNLVTKKKSTSNLLWTVNCEKGDHPSYSTSHRMYKTINAKTIPTFFLVPRSEILDAYVDYKCVWNCVKKLKIIINKYLKFYF